MEEIMHRQSAGAPARRRGELRAIDHIHIAIDHQGVAVADVVERTIDRVTNTVAPHIADGDREIAGFYRILMHRPAVRETREPHLGDVRPGESICEQRTNRIAVAKPLVEVAHVEMRVKRDEADLVELSAEAEH